MSNINHQIIVDYFSGLAENAKFIGGFFRMDLDEILGSFRKGNVFPVLVLESHEGDLGDSTIVSTSNDRSFAFTIYDNPDRDDPEDQNQKLSSSEIAGLKIIARMKHDASLPGHFLNNKFKVSSISYSKVGPVFSERLYGYRFEGSISGREPLVLDPVDWEDNPQKC